MRRLLLAVLVGVALLVPSPAHADETLSRPDWARQFLAGLGAPATRENVALVVGWMGAENTTARNNPLATTRRNDGSIGSHNSHGVQHFATVEAGVRANVDTVNAYPTMARALRENNQAAFFAAPGFRTYCTCDPAHYVGNIRAGYETALRNLPPDAPATTVAVVPPSASPAAVSSPAVSHGRDAQPVALGLMLAAGGLLFVGTGRALRGRYREASAGLAGSAACVLGAANTAGVNIARSVEHIADIAYRSPSVIADHAHYGVALWAVALTFLMGMDRSRARRVLSDAALAAWQLADRAWAARTGIYPIVLWAGALAGAVRISQSWMPWAIACAAAVMFLTTKRKAVA
jgi:hypothetical protein